MAVFGGYRSVWLMVMFDLPTGTREERTSYRQFHDFLLDDGFIRLQYSVYARHCVSEENALVHKQRVGAALPDNGEVRMLAFTDKQFGHMVVYQGRMPKSAERPPEQILLL